jgi:hypothetical protein
MNIPDHISLSLETIFGILYTLIRVRKILYPGSGMEKIRIRDKYPGSATLGPSFLTVVWSGSTPAPFPPSCEQIVALSQSSCVSPVQLTDGGWGGGEGAGGEPKLYNRKIDIPQHRYKGGCGSGSAWILVAGSYQYTAIESYRIAIY